MFAGTWSIWDLVNGGPSPSFLFSTCMHKMHTCIFFHKQILNDFPSLVIQTNVDFQVLLSEAVMREELRLLAEPACCESPLTSMTPTPESSPKLGNGELPPVYPHPLPTLSSQSPRSLSDGNFQQRKPSVGKIDYKKQQSKIRKARRKGAKKAAAKSSGKLPNTKLRPSIEKRFVDNADPIQVEHFDASNYSAASTGYVGLGGKKMNNSKKPIKFESIDKQPGMKGFRVIRWRNMWVFLKNSNTPALIFAEKSLFRFSTAKGV